MMAIASRKAPIATTRATVVAAYIDWFGSSCNLANSGIHVHHPDAKLAANHSNARVAVVRQMDGCHSRMAAFTLTHGGPKV